METVDYKITELLEAEYNPRQLTEKQYDDLTASIKKFGFVDPIIVNKHPDRDNVVVGGHQRLKVARVLNYKDVPCVEVKLTEEEERELNVRLNKNHGEWDWDLLANNFDNSQLLQWGFSEDELSFFEEEPTEGLTDDDEVPEVEESITKTGDIWILGEHRVLCGDATKKEDVERLMDGQKAELLHADPPYGMGKESEGIANDNLYREKLDAFQMEWWKSFRPYLEDNGSVYIWGNAEDLWRLWYVGGLKDSERLTFRNCIAWDKYVGNVKPTKIKMMRSYVVYREDCFFFMLGEQGFNNNADNYWEGWESIRHYLDEERKKMDWKVNDVVRITGKSSASHYFTTSQWLFPTEEHYKAMQKEAQEGGFKKDYDDLKKDFYSTRAYFDNTHDNMTDVWQFDRVKGGERHGHATPKPVQMIERIIKSSSQKKVIDPFLGSGSTLIACEKTNRKCYGMEIDAHYCDVIVKRWEDYTGKKAERIEVASA
jgi:DNA modification methylase